MDPVLELRSAMVAQMRAFDGLKALVREHVYDEPTPGPGRVKYPYVSLGPSTHDDDSTDCGVGAAIMVQVDAWSDETGQAVIAKVANQVRRAFRVADPVLTENALVDFNYWRTDFLIDGAIKHASIRFLAIVEEPST